MVASVKEFFDGLPGRVDPGRTAGVNTTYLFDIEGAGQWTVTVTDDGVDLEGGLARVRRVDGVAAVDDAFEDGERSYPQGVEEHAMARGVLEEAGRFGGVVMTGRDRGMIAVHALVGFVAAFVQGRKPEAIPPITGRPANPIVMDKQSLRFS